MTNNASKGYAILAATGLCCGFACGDGEVEGASTASSSVGTSGSGGSSSSSSASSAGGGTSSSSAGGSDPVACVTDGSLPTLSTGQTELTINQLIEGTSVERRVIVHAPATIDESKCYPLLFAFHGNGGQPDQFVGKHSDSVGAGDFIGVYPAGHLKSWNLGQENSTADDVTFVGDIVEALNAYQNIDNDRLYMVGFSNGAGMVHKLAIETKFFSAGTAIVTSLTTALLPTASSSKISILQILGENDQVIPYEGGDSPTGHTFLSGEESALTWATHNGCNTTPEVTTTAAGNEKTEYTACDEGTSVIAFKVPGAGHNIPGNFEGGLTDYFWNFLSTH